MQVKAIFARLKKCLTMSFDNFAPEKNNKLVKFV